MNDVETPMRSEDRALPDVFVGDEGSGEYEGSAPWNSAAGSETGSIKFWTDRFLNKGSKEGYHEINALSRVLHLLHFV